VRKVCFGHRSTDLWHAGQDRSWPDNRARGLSALCRRIEYQLQCQTWVASDAAVLATASVMAATVGAATEQTVGKTSQRGTDMSRNRVSDTASVFVKIGIARVMHARLDTPVTTTEDQQVTGCSTVGVATTHQMNEALLLMAVGQIEPPSVDGHELSGEGEPEVFGRERTALDLTGFDAAARFLDRARLRGKRPLGAASGWRGPTEWVGYP
jgi:hypothetical protein